LKRHNKEHKDTNRFALCLFLFSKFQTGFAKGKTDLQSWFKDSQARQVPFPKKELGSQAGFPGHDCARYNSAWHHRRTLKSGSLDSRCKIASTDIQEHIGISLGRERSSSPSSRTWRNTPSTCASNNSA
jgi:hypothetical protein